MTVTICDRCKKRLYGNKEINRVKFNKLGTYTDEYELCDACVNDLIYNISLHSVPNKAAMNVCPNINKQED